MTPKLKSVSVETDALNPNERFDFLNDIYAREKLILAPRRPIGNSISAGTSLWSVGTLGYALTHSSGHIGSREKDKRTSHLAVRKHFTGGCHSWSEDGYFVTQPGDILITMNVVDGIHACEKLVTTNISLPLDVLNFDPWSLPSSLVLRANTLGNRLLSVAMETWTNQLKIGSLETSQLLENEIVSLVNHVLGNSIWPDDDAVVSNRGEAMRVYVQDHLLDEDLSVEKICKVFGTSRASVYREFESDGGVRRYVSSLKLQKALFRISKSALKRGAVSEAAYEFGFEDPLVFSRAFRQKFGFAPTDVLGLREGLEPAETAKVQVKAASL